MKESLAQRDKKCIWHPFTPLTAPDPIPIVRGEGLYLEDENGARFIDGISSWWVTIHGHAHPYIAEQLYQQALQLEQVIFAGFTHRPAVELAERLLPLLPGDFSRVFYSDNGSTAVEVAIKMALQYWWNQRNESPGGQPLTQTNQPLTNAHQPLTKTKILAFHHSYHGDTFGAMSISERSIFTQAFADKLFEVVFIETPDETNMESLKATIRQHADEAAAFIYEPLLQGSGGMRMYSPDRMNELLETCHQHDILCIADEVMTGFGRTGRLFASEYMTRKPDIICLSKGITGGTMALGVTACNQKIVNAFITEDRLKTFFHGHSFTANPLACRASLASLDLIQKKECLDSIALITAANRRFIEKLQQLPGRHKNPRALGTIMAFELMEGEDGYLNNTSAQVTAFMLKKGIYIRPLGNTVYIMPPYCITEAELNKLYDALLELLEKDNTPA